MVRGFLKKPSQMASGAWNQCPGSKILEFETIPVHKSPGDGPYHFKKDVPKGPNFLSEGVVIFYRGDERVQQCCKPSCSSAPFSSGYMS